APNPYYTDEVAGECMQKIFLPTIKAMNAEGRTFKGCLYFGLMITKDGAKVIEYNCRFGDPETQVVLPLLKTDLLTVMQAVTEEKLSEVNVEFESANACCVIMASDGYPSHYDKGFEINVPNDIKDKVFIAGATDKNGKLVTSGGRVLGVTEIDGTLKGAIDKAYADVKRISFDNAYYRKDIGKRALAAMEVK
ncbi:MAG: phosphoribosylamine--glycine ligase, partial [Clostridia bacterium]|nr:phosphoribosylamine--glycine ligase [Clostridia bacterium]